MGTLQGHITPSPVVMKSKSKKVFGLRTPDAAYAFMLGQNDFEMSPEEADLWHGGVQCSTHTFIQGEIESESESEDG
jgi:hypothetical protein